MKKSALFFVFLLAGCATPADKIVTALNHSGFPQNAGTTVSAASPEKLQHLHADNKDAIAAYTSEIKSTCTNNIRKEDVLNTRSKAQPAFKALTKLEQFNALNDTYLKQKNLAGLIEIHNALAPLANTLS